MSGSHDPNCQGCDDKWHLQVRLLVFLATGLLLAHTITGKNKGSPLRCGMVFQLGKGS